MTRIDYRSFFVAALAGLLLLTHSNASADNTIARFSLVDRFSNDVRGPYGMQGGARMKLGGVWYQLVVMPDARIKFAELYSEKIFGPFDFVEGRLVSVGERVYRISDVKSGVAIASPTSDKNKRAQSNSKAALPPLRERIRQWPVKAGVLFDPRRSTALDWSFDGFSGSDSNPLIRNQIAAFGSWGGIEALLGLSFGVEFDDDLLDETTSLPKVESDSGEGFRLSLGYSYDVFEYESWSASIALRGEISHDEVPMRFTSLQSGSVSSNSFELLYGDDSTTVEIDETAVWGSARIAYAADQWGAYFDVAGTFYSSFEVDGGFNVMGEEYSLDAERSDPVMASLGTWFDNRNWRIFGELYIGTDTGVRLGTEYTF